MDETRSRSLLVRAGAAHALLHAGELLAWTVLCGRFLKQLGAAAMPSIYVWANLATIGLFVAAAAPRAGASKRAALRPLATAACLGGLALALRPAEDAGAVVYASFLAVWVYEIVFMPEYWGWLGKLVPMGEVKRLSAGLGACGLGGRVLGALLASDPLGLQSVPAQLLVAGVLTGAALPLLGAAERVAAGAGASADAVQEPGAGSTGGPPAPTLGASIRTVLASPLLVKILVSSLLLGFFSGVCDYPFSATAAQAYPAAADLSAFFGRFTLALYLVAIVLQLAGVEPLLARLPLGLCLSILPGLMAVGGVVGALVPGFWIASALIFCQVVVTRAIHTPVAMLLLQAVPEEVADPARALTYGAGSAAGFLAAGVGLQLAWGGAPPLEAVFAAMAAAGLFGLAAARGLDRAYLDGLAGVVGAGRPIPDEGGAGRALDLDGLPDPAARAALEGMLARDQVGEPARRLALRLLGCPDPELALAAARAAGRLGATEAVPVAVARLGDAALPPGLAVGLAGLVLRLGQGRGELQPAVRLLVRERRHPDPARRAGALEGLGGAGSPRLRASLREGLGDPDPSVVRAAARSLARLPDPAGLAALEAAAGRSFDPETRAVLDRAQGEARDRALGTMARVLGGLDRETRARAMKVLGTGAGEGAGGGAGGGSSEVLARVLGLEDPARRGAALALLGDPTVGDRVEVVAGILGGTGAPGAIACRLAARIFRGGDDPAGSLGRTLEAWLDPAGSQALAAALADPACFPTPPGDEGALRRLAGLAGLGSGRAPELAAAAASMLEDPDPRRASAAGELLESGLATPALRARLGRELKAARELRSAALRPTARPAWPSAPGSPPGS